MVAERDKVEWIVIAAQLDNKIQDKQYAAAFSKIYNNDFFKNVPSRKKLSFLLWHSGLDPILQMANSPEGLAFLTLKTDPKAELIKQLFIALKLKTLPVYIAQYIKTGEMIRKPEILNWLTALLGAALFDKPEICGVMASLISQEELLSLTPTQHYKPAITLDLFSTATNPEVLTKVLKAIQKNAANVNLSFLTYCENNIDSIAVSFKTASVKVGVADALAGLFFNADEGNLLEAERDNKKLKLGN